jgi:hypothetical protein
MTGPEEVLYMAFVRQADAQAGVRQWKHCVFTLTVPLEVSY